MSNIDEKAKNALTIEMRIFEIGFKGFGKD